MIRLLKISVLTGLAVSLPSFATADELDWWSIDKEVSRQLMSQERNLVEWARDSSHSTPSTAVEAATKLNLCMRACLDKTAIEAMDELFKLEPSIQSSFVSNVFYRATDDFQAWNVALALVETFAPRINEASLQNRLFRHFQSAERGPARWTDARLTEWINARYETVVEYNRTNATNHGANVVSGVSAPSNRTPIAFWRDVRLKHLAKIGKADALIETMAADVRAHPMDAEQAMELLRSLQVIRDTVQAPDLDWMATACRPRRATDMRSIGTLLMTLQQPQVAQPFLRRAMETKLTANEIEEISATCQAMISAATHRQYFDIGVREELAKCLLAIGETDAAQRMMVAAADIRHQHGLPLNSYLAGSVQSESGEAVIQVRIREQEASEKDDAKYWRSRANYFRGLGDKVEQEKALRKALTLSPRTPLKIGKGVGSLRPSILSDMVRFLTREDRTNEAVTLLIDELRDAPVDSASAAAAARILAFDLKNQIDPEEKAFWSWLANRQRWSHTEERLLWQILQATPTERLDAAVTRAEDLASGVEIDASRPKTLGWILNRMGKPARSIPLLQTGAKTTSSKVQASAAFALFESYLDVGNWRQAEAIFDQANKQLTPAESPQWLGRIAILAAEQQDTVAAARIWRRVANCSLRCHDLADALSERGLRQEISQFYASVQQQLPNANIAGLVD